MLEMDVAMLKEIDLVAFGRRVHIYNAIKELKIRVPKPSRADVVSPSLSGYEPDSPGNLSFASPGQASFSFPSEDTQGLGFEDDASSLARPSSSVRFLLLSPRAIRLTALRIARPECWQPSASSLYRRHLEHSGFADNSQAFGHRRHSGQRCSGLARPADSRGGQRDRHASSLYQDSHRELHAAQFYGGIPCSPRAHLQIAASPAIAALASSSRSNSTREKSKPASRRSGTDKSDTSAPPSPIITRRKKDSGASDRSSTFFGAALGRNRKPPPRVPT